MCGIALIISGVRFDLSSLFPNSPSPSSPESNQVHEPRLSVDDLKAALRRRGPNHLGSRKVFFQLKSIDSVEKEEYLSCLNVKSVGYNAPIGCCVPSVCFRNENQVKGLLSDLVIADYDNEEETKTEKEISSVSFTEIKKYYITSKVITTQDTTTMVTESDAELHFLGATLQLRGISPVLQPLVDTSGNLLVFNGEIFGGIDVGSDSNDTEILMRELEKCCSCDCHGHKRVCYCAENEGISVPELLSTIKGPYALIYWQARSKTIWFGRDAFGRRSLLVHWPTLDDSRFLLSSVSPPPSAEKSFGSIAANNNVEPHAVFKVSYGMGSLGYWEELSCGIYSICLDASKVNSQGNTQNLIGEVRKHEWRDTLLKKLIKWERNFVEPESGSIQYSVSLPAHKVLSVLRDSVMHRTTLNTLFQRRLDGTRAQKLAPIALLFSGGLDSMILAALTDQCLDANYEIDLLNVSFDGQFAPDRISARAGLKELQRIAPSRRWRLVEIDADLSCLTFETQHVMSLINPANTYMDLNIGIALWLAASGEGWVDEEACNLGKGYNRLKFKSEAKILLVGSGADEQCAGYSRHRTKYRMGGWHALEEEMKLDMQRIWKRNLGRDDRCIADNGKEARFPFLDEDVIRTLLEIPLWEIAELDLPVGRGDKKILREVARLLGLEEAAVQPKRAIQFGSRIARESNRKNFGSNRAANQASAGSVVIHEPTN
ncbi:asparagine synthase family protein isoform X1 [Tasmannia lanceolata]|uniref:asparagine synthase family protein isoform X1 n=1 Tax=Tasmannia lanceolata TaxID=3420 RepID=UPI004062F50A